jgi:hypothetical protein
MFILLYHYHIVASPVRMQQQWKTLFIIIHYDSLYIIVNDAVIIREKMMQYYSDLCHDSRKCQKKTKKTLCMQY